MEDQQAKTIIQRLKQLLEEIRKPWELIWKDVAEYVVPIRSDIEQSGKEGERRGTRVYNGTAISALQLFADGMHGYLISPSIQWFRLRMADASQNEHPEVKLWLQEVEKLLYGVFQRSNFYQAMSAYFEDGGSIGTATIYSEEDIGSGRVIFQTIHPAQIYIAENIHGMVDTVFRKYRISARNAVENFGDRVSDRIKNASKNNPYEKFEFIHAVFPRKERVPEKNDARNMPYASYWVEVSSQQVVRESGYRVMPYAVWRYKKGSDETYGRSPAILALTDIMTLNQISKTMLGVANLAADPPYNVPANMKGRVRIVPGGINYYEDANMVVTPVRLANNYPVGVDREDRVRQIIEEHFKVDFWVMLARSERQMTAVEVMERQGEKAVVLGAAIGRLISECLNPIIDRVFQIELDAGRLPPVPDILLEQGGDIDVDYMGPLAQAQKRLFKTYGIIHGLEGIRPIASIRQDVLDIIDFDEITREVLESSGFPQKAIRPREQVQAIRQARTEEIQAKEMADQLEQATDAVKKLAEADQVTGGSISELIKKGAV